MVATPVTQFEVCTMSAESITLINVHMHALKMQVKLTAGVIVRIINKKKRGGSDQCEARHGYVGGKLM